MARPGIVKHATTALVYIYLDKSAAPFPFQHQELREALLADDSALPGCGEEWVASLSSCSHSVEGLEHVAIAWDELRAGVAGWLEAPGAQDGLAPPGAGARPLTPVAVERCAARVLEAVRRLAPPGPGQDAAHDLIGQLPIDAILCYDTAALAALQAHLGLQAGAKQDQTLVAALAARPLASAPQEPIDEDEGELTDIEP